MLCPEKADMPTTQQDRVPNAVNNITIKLRNRSRLSGIAATINPPTTPLNRASIRNSNCQTSL
jgi:hypothetical protein